jgi:hypothetical protein
MKRIRTSEEIARKKRINTIIISSVMLLLLVFSTIGFAFVSQPSYGNDDISEDYNVDQTGRVYVDYQGLRIELLSSYDEIIDVRYEVDLIPAIYNGQTVYIASENEGIYQQLLNVFGRGVASRVQRACYGPCEDDLPEKECNDMLIVWRENIEQKVSQEENCIFIDGDLRAVDAFVYNLFS